MQRRGSGADRRCGAAATVRAHRRRRLRARRAVLLRLPDAQVAGLCRRTGPHYLEHRAAWHRAPQDPRRSDAHIDPGQHRRCAGRGSAVQPRRRGVLQSAKDPPHQHACQRTRAADGDRLLPIGRRGGQHRHQHEPDDGAAGSHAGHPARLFVGQRHAYARGSARRAILRGGSAPGRAGAALRHHHPSGDAAGAFVPA